MYAGDTVLFAESANELQALLNDFVPYCNDWKLKINPENTHTKIMVFGERIKMSYKIRIKTKH